MFRRSLGVLGKSRALCRGRSNIYQQPIRCLPRLLSSASRSLAKPVQRPPVTVPLRFASQVVSKMSGKTFERLPPNVVPKHYAVQLKPDLNAFTFAGEQTVNVSVVEATKTIVMNSADITISSAEFVTSAGSVPAEVSFVPEQETVTLTFQDALAVGDGQVKMTFAGELNDKMKGFYRSKYTSPCGEERYCAVTQFEATDARRALPCWDEPALKATFDVTLVVPQDRVALSNMPVKNEESLANGLRSLTYETTPIMSTYLLAFIVGEYDYVEARDEDGVLVRVFTPVGKKEQGTFALDVAVKTLPFYKKYFNIPYPLPKMDLIAIADFAAGAMENWGLVTYRETALLVDPVESSASSRQWVALVVGHEIAHQWFGNLVTMEWWTHLWLNEGFASWIEYLCVDECFPEYDIWTQFVTHDLIRALDLDAMSNSHAIEVPVGHPDEIDEIFDAISYSKGSSVIRMLHAYIGDEAFRAGMHNYLSKHAYKNTFTEDLWEALGDASGKPVGKIMQTWTEKMGFPVLEADMTRKGSDSVVTMSQRHFGNPGSDSQWIVPVGACSSEVPQSAAATAILEGKTGELVVPNSAGWVKLNPGAVGFYRVKYSASMLDALLPAVRNQVLEARDRLNLQDDLFALAQSGQATTVDALRLTEAYISETNYTVWLSLSTNIASIYTLLAGGEHAPAMSSFVQKLVAPVLERIGWEGDDGNHLTALLRSLAVGMLGRHGHAATLEEANKRFRAHINEESSLHADLRSPVYQAALSSNDAAVFDDLVALFDKADMHEERVRIMRSLGAASSQELIERALQFSISEKVRAQDTVFVIGSVSGHSTLGRDMAWTFLKDNWTMLYDRYQVCVCQGLHGFTNISSLHVLHIGVAIQYSGVCYSSIVECACVCVFVCLYGCGCACVRLCLRYAFTMLVIVQAVTKQVAKEMAANAVV